MRYGKYYKIDNIDPCELQEIVSKCKSMSDLMDYFGYHKNTTSWRKCSKAIKEKLNLDYSLLFSQKRTFHDNYTKKQNPKQLRLAMLKSGFDNCCSKCRLSSWLDSPIRLDIDHIDGNNLNNNIENLRFLCPNCHRQTPTCSMPKKYLPNN